MIGSRNRAAFQAGKEGAVAVMYALAAIPLLIAIGGAIDLSRAVVARFAIQDVADAAVLATAFQATSTSTTGQLTARVNTYLAANRQDTSTALVGSPSFNTSTSEVCINVSDVVATSFLKIARISTLPVSVNACASAGLSQNLGIAMVIDVSTSMVEANRFTPMQSAVGDFLNAFSSNASYTAQTKIALVPFSTRINIGMTHTDWLTAYSGNPAVPSRWTNPTGYYGSGYSRTYWIDGVTPDMTTSGNYYWIGCIEPRADLDVNSSGSVGSEALTDATPQSYAFVPNDDNTIPSGTYKGKISEDSFCSPPVTPLTNDFNKLNNATKALTSEGSTRLDAGLLGGYYSLSPNWSGLWGTASSPAAYSSSVRKIVILMTDGAMNTESDKPSSNPRHMDWLCKNNYGSACDTLATQEFLQICTNMKSAGIEIYTIGYDPDADSVNLPTCATDSSHYYTATSTSSSTYVETVFKQIAQSLTNSSLRLTQ